MSFLDWARETADRIRRDGVAGATESAYEFYVGALRRVGRIYDPGEPIYDREWDVLLVLDACRYDLLEEVADEYDFLGTRDRFTSAGSSSREWMEHNFGEEFAGEMARTAHVTGNPFSDRCLDPEQFARLDEVWRYAWDDDLGTIRPRPLTDRAVDAWRNLAPDRLIVHYMQPHYPFLTRPDLHDGMVVAGFGDAEETFWERVRRGDVSTDVAWEAYRENLRYVLEEVEFLLSTIDADRVVVTADHGNAIGRWGIYGHPSSVPMADLRRVPWVETTASRENDYEPEVTPDPQADDRIESRLEDLGYL